MKGNFTRKAFIYKHLLSTLLITLAMFVSANSFAQKIKYSDVKIYLGKEDIHVLQEAGMQFDHFFYNEEEGSMAVTITDAEMIILKKTGFKFTIVEDDAEQAFIKRSNVADFFKSDLEAAAASGPSRSGLSFFESPNQNIAGRIATPAAFTAGSMGGYYTWPEVQTKMANLKATYPSLVRLDTIGTTYEGRPLVVLKLSDNVNTDENEPEILYTGMHHAREPLGMMNLIFFMQYLCENYGSNARIKEIVDSRELFFLPVLNPDGYERNRASNPGGGGLHRKNVVPYPSNGGNPGADLNRNYGFDWGFNNVGSSNLTNNDAYRGPSAFSENETQAMRAYVRTRQFRLMINYHAYGGYWINSYSVPSRTLTAAQSTYASTAGQQMTKYNFYKVGTPSQTVGYEANGSSDDWFFAGDIPNIGSLPCFSPEVGLGLATFWPASTTILGYCKQVFHSNIQAALVAGSMAKIEDRTPINLSSLSSQASFTLRRLGNVDSSVRVTIIPLVNIQSVGAPVVISSLPNYLDTVNRSIAINIKPTISAGNIVRFVYKIETGGITQLDTVNVLYSAQNLFSDNGETGVITAKWTRAGSTSWDYTTTSAYAGTKSLTESPAGNYPASLTNSITTATPINLSGATAAYLTFWTRYLTEPGNDKFQVQISSPANGNVYTATAGINTVTESALAMGNVPGFSGLQNYWVKEVIDLKPHLGQSAVNIRFVFTSNAGTTVNDGVYLDEITVVKSTLATLPTLINSFTGVMTKTGSDLKWEATIDSDHDYFELERSADGKDFLAISKVTSTTLNSYLDRTPLKGNNYYRLKQVSKSGNAVYSTIILLYNNTTKKVTLSPTIVTNNLTVTVVETESEKLNIEVLDATGRLVKMVQYQANPGTQKINVEMGALANQQYFIKVKNQRNETLSIQPIVKQ